MPRLIALCSCLIAAFAFADEGLLLYAPFDDSADAAIAAGDARNLGSVDQQFVEGIRGQAVAITKDCLLAREGNFLPETGTFSVFIRPNWDAADPAPHYVFCVYGSGDLPQAWMTNRFSCSIAGDRCTLSLYTSTPGEAHHLVPVIPNWWGSPWHHLVITWENINSENEDAIVRIFADGEKIAEMSELQLDVGPMSDVLAIGRDQDGSPDYADADMDELFIYDRALTPEEIVEGHAWLMGASAAATAAAETPAREPVAGWWDARWPYRLPVNVPAADRPREGMFVQCPISPNAQLAELGLTASALPDSLRVVDADGNVLPSRFEDGLLEWSVPGTVPAGTSSRFHIYFMSRTYDVFAPLQARDRAPEMAPGPRARPAPDYATLTFGKPWDFEDGTVSGIDQWGDKPEYLFNRKVEDGVLKMDVKQDPFFVWGDMWGQIDEATRKIAIDIDQFPVLEMRVRQSAGAADWAIFGRPGTGERLLNHKFRVTGTGWQRIRINLLDEARWQGTLSAFRIDPTEDIEAHVEIDWVRLTGVVPVAHEPLETIGNPGAEPRFIALRVAPGPVDAGSRQDVRLELFGPEHEPLAGHPVRISLEPGSGGRLIRAQGQPSLGVADGVRRGLTDAKGQFTVTYVADRRARDNADRITASAEFADCARATVTTRTLPGPPHHYSVSPAEVVTRKQEDGPLALTAQLVDEFGNSVAQARAITWETDAPGQLTGAADQTDETGRAGATWLGDEAKRWVYHVRVRDDGGLSGESAAICLLPSQSREDPIVLGDSGYFRRGADGPSWLALGGFYANWVGLPLDGEEGRQLVSFVDATEEQLEHWLQFLADQGVTGMRFMLRAHRPNGMEPMDVVGRVNMPLFARVLRYLDLARKHDIRFMLTIHEDYTKPAYYNHDALEKFCLPRFAAEDLDALPAHQRRFIRDRELLKSIEHKYTDPDVIACQDQYTRELVGLLRDNPQLFSWEFENEMVACPESWADHMAAVIREVDPVTPICASHGGGGLHTADPWWWTQRTDIDFYTYHIYPTGTTTAPGFDYGAAVDVLTCYGRMAGTCMMGESAGDEFSRYPEERDADRRYLMRDIIWFGIANGDPGSYFWNARGFEVEQFRLANQITAGIDWTTWKRQPAPVAVNISHPWDDDRYYRTPEGREDYLMMGRYAQHYLSAGVDFDFVMGDAGGRPVCDLSEFAPQTGTAWLAPSPGWQVRTNAREGLAEGLAYVRNFAGVWHWEEPDGRRRIDTYLRDRAVAPLQLRLNLPAGMVSVVATDLDTGEQVRVSLPGDGVLDLGPNDHDWAVHWTAP